jgi:inhibitor of cysteine peptidase
MSSEIDGMQGWKSRKYWLSPIGNGFLCPKYQIYLDRDLVEELELIEVIPPMFLNASDNNTAINATTGEFLIVTLEGNPTTGYTWEVEELNEQVLQQVGDIVSVPESDLMGAPSMQIATFEVVGAGNATIKMVYHRPRETDVEPVDTFTLNVTAS